MKNIKNKNYTDWSDFQKGLIVEEIEIEKIRPFAGSPFYVDDNSELMEELVESIQSNGILAPLSLRIMEDEECYEIISGHKRYHAAKKIGLTSVPAFVRKLEPDLATIFMVDSNLNRSKLLHSEKAFAYKMRYDAMRNIDEKVLGRIESQADEELARIVGESRCQVYRYMRLTELIPSLLKLVDKEKIALCTAVDISYLRKDVQRWIYEYVKEKGVIKDYQIMALRAAYRDDEYYSQMQMNAILNDNLPTRLPSHRVAFTGTELHQFFPAYYSAEEMKTIIIKLLENWKSEQIE